MSELVSTDLKRKRSAPFSLPERNFIKELILKHEKVLDKKSFDLLTRTEKNKAWKLIAKEFNGIPHHIQRTEKQLRKCWDNMKMEKKKEIRLSKRAAIANNTGPPSCAARDDSIEVFHETLATEINVIDSDTHTLVENGTNKFFILSEKSTLEATPQDVVETEIGVETTGVFTDECEYPQNANSIINSELPTASTPATASDFPSHLFRSGKGGARHNAGARTKQVELTKQESEISQYLVREAKYKAMAAEMVYKEKAALLQKAELEIKIKQLELKILQDINK